MGQNLSKEEVKKIIAEELDDLVQGYNVSIENIDVDITGEKVQVTFGLHTVPEDNYIGLAFY
jgi:hypothetical protein